MAPKIHGNGTIGRVCRYVPIYSIDYIQHVIICLPQKTSNFNGAPHFQPPTYSEL